MAIRRRVSGTQTLTPASVIEAREAAERLAGRAADARGVADPKRDPYPGSTPDSLGIPGEQARSVMMGLGFEKEQPAPNEMRVQDLLVCTRMMNNPGDNIERTYRNRIGSPMTGIRAFCVDCQGGSPRAVAKCDMVSCPLWPFRMGRNRFRSK